MDITNAMSIIGVETLPYKRGPVGKDVFAITLDGTKFRFWEGKADIIVNVDEKKRQAVITVKEKPRIINTSINVNCYDMPNCSKTYTQKQLAKFVRDEICSGNNFFTDETFLRSIRNRAIQVPNARMKIVGYSKNPSFSYTYTLLANRNVKVQLEFTTRSTTTSFLVGFDTDSQNRPFVCQLRDVVSTVNQAHKSLLPKNVKLKKGYKRQGEWFFNPVSDKELSLKLIEKIHCAKVAPLDGRTTHRTMTLTHDGKRYAIGQVKDTRHGRHESLILDKWYEVVRNNEVQVSNSRRVTWD